MKRVFKKIFLVYSWICTAIVTVLIIASIVVFANLGKISAQIAHYVVKNYSDTAQNVLSNALTASFPDGSIQLELLSVNENDELQAVIKIDNSLLPEADIEKYLQMTNAEIIADIGITISDIPPNIYNILKTVTEPINVQIKNDRGEIVINRVITIKELMAQW
ncbi:hypothetical protein FACS189483_05890 [Spirochaetia bacterium]|nr:hypothetical protein FACS189483_05890 [Spirochaetia bacterium]